MPATLRDRILDFLNRHLFSVLSGIRFERWMTLLKDNRFAVAPRYWPRAAIITLNSVLNSVKARREERLFGARIRSTSVVSPVFILGHWRSGTTHLHNVLAIDRQFAAPNIYQVFFPDTFLCTEDTMAPRLARLIPPRRPQDNVALSFEVPQEDEYALCVSGLRSQYLAWVFPKRQVHYERYLTMRDVPGHEVTQWKEAFLTFARKMTVKYGRTLLLKSPTHTARIRLVLELFPDARFIHIHRHPLRVFVSSRHSYDRAAPPYFLQVPNPEQWDDLIVSRYEEMYSAYLEQRNLIRPGRLCEVAFEDLQRDPLAQIRRIYQTLGLSGLAAAEPRMHEYLLAQQHYQTNEYSSLAPQTRALLERRWARFFAEFHYEMSGIGGALPVQRER